MQKIIFILKVTVICCLIASCSSGKAITGEISHVNGEVVCLPSRCFKLLPNAPKCVVGDTVTFTPTLNRKKINSKRIK